MDNADVFKYGFSTYGPLAVSGRTGLFRVIFTPKQLMPCRGLNQAPELMRRWEAELLIDSKGKGTVIEHRKLEPSVAELDDADFEAKALELVRRLAA